MPLTPGTSLGPYRITAPLGAGGMGEVYRAHDTRLGRDVALKILPAEMANDPSRRARFETEARAVAALNHPNIVAVYDVGEGYIVSELVDGEPLGGARLPLRKIVDVAAQIASGLAAAHEAGVVHRDLKPDNILLTRDGRPKILDFGLAKMRTPPAAESSETVTLQTDPGVVMGTVGYMSPEQVRGLEVDYRSDIFSFGVILHELLSGKRAFSGETSVDTLSAILHQEAEELPETAPATLRRIVTRCLEKDPANRFQSARDLAFALEGGTAPSGPVAAVAPKRVWRWPAAALASGLIGLAAGWLLFRAPAQSVWTGVPLGGPEVALIPRISPDGHTLAMLTLIDGQSQVAVMRPDAGDWAVLTHDRDLGWGASLSWSPDGNRIYYDRFTGVPKGIYAVPVLGGSSRLVVENAVSPESLPDGSLLAVHLNSRHEAQVFRYWPETGKSQDYPLQAPIDTFQAVRPFPGGREAAVIGRPVEAPAGSRDHLYVLDLVSGQSRRLVADVEAGLSVSRDGRSVLGWSRTPSRMLRVPAAGGGRPSTLFPLINPASSDNGVDGSMYVDQLQKQVQLIMLSGAHARTLASTAGDRAAVPTILPDGRVLWMERVASRARVVAYQAGKLPVPLVNTSEETSSPTAPAGPDRVALLIGPETKRQIAIAGASTGKILTRIPFDKGTIEFMVAAPDAKSLYCAASHVIWNVPVSGGEPSRIRDGDAVSIDPNGKFLVVMWNETSTTRMVKVSLTGGPEEEIRVDGPIRPTLTGGPNVISRDGRMVIPLTTPDSWYFIPGILDLASGRLSQIPTDLQGDYNGLSWTSDGGVVGIASPLRSSIWKFTPEKQ